MKSLVSHIGGKEYAWTFNGDGTFVCNGKPVAIELRPISQDRVSVILNGKSYDAAVSSNSSGYDVLINGILVHVEVESRSVTAARRLGHAFAAQSAGVEVRSPMPGMVVRLEVSAGSRVQAGDGLLILEAMKMENEIKSKTSGAVHKVMVTEKQIVDKGQLLLVIQ